MNWKQRITQATSDKRRLQKRLVRLHRSFGEVQSLLNSKRTKK